MNKHKKLFKIFYIVGYILTAIMLILTIIFKNYNYYFTNNEISTLATNIPITCILFIVSTIFLILVLCNKHKIKTKNQNKNQKLHRNIFNKNIILKVIYYTTLILSILFLMTIIIILNIPIINAILIPIEITFLILSIVFFIISKEIKNHIRYKMLIEKLDKFKQNRDI